MKTKTILRIAYALIILGFVFNLAETAVFIYKYGWHYTATQPDEILCDKIAEYTTLAGIFLIVFASPRRIAQVLKKRNAWRYRAANLAAIVEDQADTMRRQDRRLLSISKELKDVGRGNGVYLSRIAFLEKHTAIQSEYIAGWKQKYEEAFRNYCTLKEATTANAIELRDIITELEKSDTMYEQLNSNLKAENETIKTQLEFYKGRLKAVGMVAGPMVDLLKEGLENLSKAEANAVKAKRRAKGFDAKAAQKRNKQNGTKTDSKQS